MKNIVCVPMQGPLSEYQQGYLQSMSEFNFSVSAAKRHLYLMAHLSRWMKENTVTCLQLDDIAVEHFFADRRSIGYARFRTPKGLSQLLAYLREQGAAPKSIKLEKPDAVTVLLKRFTDYLANERGLSPGTIVGYRHKALLFLQACHNVSADEQRQIDACNVHAFISNQCSKLSVGTTNNVVTALRSLLQFLYLKNLIPTSLAETVFSAATWQDPGRSRALSALQVKALLESCDRRTHAGRRDFAILTILAHTGLRAAEVASMTLEGMDWQAGEFTFIGKGSHQEKLPLLFDVGQAIADYCQYARPKNTCRSLFLNGRAPFQAISASSVSHLVLRASQRAGIAPARAHQLRHSAASNMRKANLPMAQISQVLRHQHSTTTAVYAKEGAQALTSIARAWPGVQS